MKAVFLALAALGSVAAINLDGIPDCAVPCLKEAIPEVGCDLDDTACQCSTATQEKLVSVVSPCLLKKCSANELNRAQEAAGAACAAYSASAVATTPAITKTVVATTVKVPSTPGNVLTTPASNSTATKTKTSGASETETETETETGNESGSGSESTATGSSSVPSSTDNAASVAGPAVGALLAVFAAALAL
ncbi:hypothetical protein B0T10DRAFT_460664 [Thelonectria olida]|uniref:CFEM domain-containing protein n=1 Tax=Thelonectria olida TaxID=1576542 RepID=A0A9P9AP43_9HYPO|nr:hypothetical protein B0T10DRAFT_460664 [Thelonectria olida]